MKVSNIKDIDKFFAVVDSCEGRVIPELEIVAYEKDDIDKLMSFMING